MIKKEDKNVVRTRIHRRIRKKISGTAAKPRVCVFRSNSHIAVQVIDDVARVTLCSCSTQELKLSGSNIANATKVGEELARRMKDKGLEVAVFDRGGYLYHGKIKAVAQALRDGGIKF